MSVVVAGGLSVLPEDRVERTPHLLDVLRSAGIKCVLHDGILGAPRTPEGALQDFVRAQP